MLGHNVGAGKRIIRLSLNITNFSPSSQDIPAEDIPVLRKYCGNWQNKWLYFKVNGDPCYVPIMTSQENVLGGVFFIDSIARTYMLRIKTYNNPVSSANYKCFQL